MGCRCTMLDERTRQLRKNTTDAEHRLWHYLRLRQLEGHKFRKQVRRRAAHHGRPFQLNQSFNCLIRLLVPGNSNIAPPCTVAESASMPLHSAKMRSICRTIVAL